MPARIINVGETTIARDEVTSGDGNQAFPGGVNDSQLITPAALQSKPMHMVRACLLPWARARLKKLSRLKATRRQVS